MRRAREPILAAGGAERTNVFTRAQLRTVRPGTVAGGAGDANGDHAPAALVSISSQQDVVLVTNRHRAVDVLMA